jgi:hypothetical protein
MTAIPFGLVFPPAILIHQMTVKRPTEQKDDGKGRLVDPLTVIARDIPCFDYPEATAEADEFQREGFSTGHSIMTTRDMDALGLKEGDQVFITGPGMPKAGLRLNVKSFDNQASLGLYWLIQADKRT